jgi:carboxylesterase
VVIGGDLLYAGWTALRYRHWEKGVERGKDGVRVGCEAFTVGQGDTAILFVHGYADAPAVWKKKAEALAERGYTCRALRLPGFAQPIETYQTTSLVKWKETVRDEAADLRESHEQVWIAGHSTGGALALHLAVTEPDLVDGIILHAPLLKVSDRRSPLLKTHQWFAIGDRILNASQMVENIFPIEGDDPAVGNYPYRDPFVPMVVVRDLFALMKELEGQAPRVRQPVLLFHGGQDKVVDNEVAQSFFDNLGSSVKERVDFPRAGHAIPIDSSWEESLERTDVFIRENTTKD